MNRKHTISIFCLILLVFLNVTTHAEQNEPLSINLEQCLNIALQNNHFQKISQLSVKMAEAQYNQALSAYYPDISIGFSATRMDESSNFIFPEEISQYQIQLPAQIMNPALPAGTMISMPTTVTVPEKDVKLMDRDTLISRAEMTWPLFMGGRRKAIVEQASIGVQAAKIYSQRTDMQLIHDISQKYYGAIIARTFEQECKTVMDVSGDVITPTNGKIK